MQGNLVNPEVHVERQELTVFSNEGDIATGTHVEPTKEPDRMELAATDELTNDVKGFLERPILYETIDWLATQSQGVLLTTMQLPRDWLNQQMIKEKLAGFMYFHCDFEYTVQVNAQPFNAGRLLIAYEPLSLQQAYQPSAMHHFGGITGFRHVQLDLAESTSATLRIPYHAIMSHHDLIRGNGTQGRVVVYIYSPLSGLVDVDFTVWIRAVDARAEMPTGLPMHAPVPPTNYGVAQANLKAEKTRPGNIETISRTAGTIAKVASGIPGIGGIATAGAAIADAVAGVASMFGWSKPTDPEFPTKVEIGYGRYTANANGDAKTKSLALDARNAVEIASSLGNTSEDEMALKTILSRPIYYDRFSMAKTDLPGQVLYSTPVDPTACQKGEVLQPDAIGVVCNNTNLSYLSNLFQAYRGGIVYDFKIVKTPFHSGRFEVVFVPGAHKNTTLGQVDRSKVYRAIYDLRETTNVKFTVPFVWNTPFKSIRNLWDPENPLDKTWIEPIGMLYVTVVNGLRNPSTCADLIEIIVEVSAADDFQFAGPMMAPIANGGKMMSILRRDELAGPVTYGIAQADLVPMSTSGFAMNNHGMGEVIESLRFLLKRYTSAEYMVNNPIDVYQPSWVGTNPTIANLIDQKSDVYTWVSQLYRFMTGSMRLAFMPPPSDQTINGYTLTAKGLGMIDTDTIAQFSQRGNVYQFPTIEPFAEVHVPFYQQTCAIPTSLGQPAVSDNMDIDYFAHVPFNVGTEVTVYNATTGVLRSADDVESFHTLRSIGEDFSFFYLVGPPRTGVFFTPPPP